MKPGVKKSTNVLKERQTEKHTHPTIIISQYLLLFIISFQSVNTNMLKLMSTTHNYLVFWCHPALSSVNIYCFIIISFQTFKVVPDSPAYVQKCFIF